MDVVEVDQLLQEIAPDSPCGEDLEDDPQSAELERLAEGKAEQQIGDDVIKAEEPDWRGVRKHSIALLGRSKDLRTALHLTRALLHTDGFAGLADGLDVFKGLMTGYWEPVHPRLDPTDDNDPMFRVNILSSLASRSFLLSVRQAPLVRSKVMGQFGLRDLDVAGGELSPGSDEEPPTMAAIDGAFQETELDDLQATADVVGRALESAEAIEATLTEKVGLTKSADLSGLAEVLKVAQAVLADHLTRRGVSGAASADVGGAQGVPAAAAVSGEINSRADVVRILDRACEYFERNEPSSPVPLLLQRAKRLTSMNFMEIIRDMAPDGAAQAETIGGRKGEE